MLMPKDVDGKACEVPNVKLAKVWKCVHLGRGMGSRWQDFACYGKRTGRSLSICNIVKSVLAVTVDRPAVTQLESVLCM